MEITEIRTRRLVLPLHTTFITALRQTRWIETLVVEVSTDEGIRGFGEACQVWQVTGESMDGARACIEGPLAARVIGRDPADILEVLREVRSAVAGNTGAKAAIDIALHDVLARSRDLLLARMLGGTATAVPTDVTLPVGSPEELAAAAVDRVAEGFRALKLKVGGDAEQTVRTALTIRDAVGADVSLRLDANQAWDDRQAVRIIGQLEDAGTDVELIEQPVPAHDVAALERVTRRVNTPIMADEAVFGIPHLLEIIGCHAADMINVKLAKCGGLAVAGTLLECARAAGLGTIVGSMMESPIGVTAAASLAAAHGTTAVSDLDAAWWMSANRSPLRYESGTVVLPARPGLGIDAINDLEVCE